MQDFIDDKLLKQDRIDALKAIFENIREVVKDFDDVYYDGVGKVERIETSDDISGYVPYTNGGFTLRIDGMISTAFSEGVYPRPVKSLVDQYGEAVADTSELDLAEGEEPNGDDHAQWADGFYHYDFSAQAYLKGNWRGQIEGVDHILFRVGINPYDPGEQGEKTEYLYERAVPFKDLTVQAIKVIGRVMIAAVNQSRLGDVEIVGSEETCASL